MLPAFFSNTKLEQFQITVFKQSHDLSETVIFLKEIFTAAAQMYLCILNVLYVPGPSIHDTCISIEYQSRAIAGHCFEAVS